VNDFKQLGTLTKVTAAALALYAMVEFGFGLLWLSLYRSPEAAADSEGLGLLALVSIGALVMVIVCIILVGCWTYRASANAHSFSDEMTISPGWAVGWYFVPIANLFKPYQAMREIWMASHFRGNWHDEPTPPLLIAWWALWIITNILGNISLQLTMLGSTGQSLAATALINGVIGLAKVPLSLILITIMRQIARAQTSAPYAETFA
jgi:hypothetical protein